MLLSLKVEVDYLKWGAGWFASYWYYLNKDSTEKSWDNRNTIKTVDLRIKVFNHSTKYHNDWRKEILKMKDKNLERNKLGLKGSNIKKFVK